MNSINGYSYGQLAVSGNNEFTVNFPLTNRGGGLEEITVFRQIRQETTNFDIDNPVITQLQRAQGYDIIWHFHYEDWITGEELYNKFYPVLKAWKAGDTMTLTPRIDAPRSFEVILINETLSMRLNKATQTNKYHKGILFSFQTKHMQSDPLWIPTPQQGDPVIIAAINEFNYNA